MEERTQCVKKDAAKTREERISRLRRKMEIEKDLKELQGQLSSLGERDVEEINRQHVIKLIELFIQKSLEELASIMQEVELLNKIKEMRERDVSFPDLEQQENRVESRPRDANGPLLSRDGRPLKPFIITSQRQTLSQQVFRPGWRLPTMTIEEYLQQENERGNIISGGGKMPEKEEVDDNDETGIDAATYKAREWDDFKDSNPRGWGNRMGKG